MTVGTSSRIALALLVAACAPGCVLYARVPLARGPMIAPAGQVSAAWSASGSASHARASLDGACASLGPCATGNTADGVQVIADFTADMGVSATSSAASGARSVMISSADARGSSDAYAAVGASGEASGSADANGGASAYAVGTSDGTAIASVSVTGRGRGLLSIAGEGTTVDGHIAALDLLTPLAGALSADASLGGDRSFAWDASVAHDALPRVGGDTSIVVRIAGGAAPSRIPPRRVHLVLDASTSMQSTWGDLQDAALHLIARLRPEDELQIVVYGTDAREALAPIRVGDGARARGVIRALRPSGRTNIEAGLRIAYRAVRAHASIVVVLSDGVPNGGLATPDELGALAAEANARGAITTAIGIGWDFHPGILRALADRGHGRFRIAPRTAELGAILDAELAARGHVAAHDVELAITLAPGVRIDGELPSGIELADGGARLVVPAIAAGEEHVVVIPVEVPPGREARGVARVDARWTPIGSTAAVRGSESLAVAVAARPVLAGSALAVLDSDLATALGLAASAVTNGDAAQAALALRAHADRARAHVAVRPLPALSARVEHVAMIATALERLVPGASWHDRRALGASMLSFSASFGAR